MGGDRFNLGDAVAFADGRCRVCVCDNPPQLTCTRKQCPGTQSSHAHVMDMSFMTVIYDRKCKKYLVCFCPRKGMEGLRVPLARGRMREYATVPFHT